MRGRGSKVRKEEGKRERGSEGGGRERDLPSEQVPSAASMPFLNLGPALSSLRDTIADIHATTLEENKEHACVSILKS